MQSRKHTKPPSSGSAGFFQTKPRVVNAFLDDPALKRVFSTYLSKELQDTLAPDLRRFGSLVLDPSVLAHTADAERNPPYVKTWDSFGNRVDEIVTSHGWRALTAISAAEGLVAIPYEREQRSSGHGPYARVHQFLKTHLWAPTAAQVSCPAAMSDGAARLLANQLSRETPPLSEAERAVFAAAFERLTSRDPAKAWTSGQWMTERPGGSDVSATETQATLITTPAEDGNVLVEEDDADGMALGPYSIDGFKWFSSATDSQMAVLLARLPDDTISAFYAPMRRRAKQQQASTGTDHQGEEEGGAAATATTTLNGIRIQRLKSKLGTRPVPTAELVLRGLRAWPVGRPGQGVREISTILNVTRAHNAVAAVGLLGRGLAVSRAHARVRRVKGRRLLADNALHVRTMAAWAVEYAAMMHLAFATAALLGVAESGARGGGKEGPGEVVVVAGVEWLDGLGLGVGDAVALLKLLTPLAKALTARAAIAGLAECMESLGGVGYLENEDVELNLARLFRDANVLSIWEGTTNVMADDLVRVVKGKEGETVLGSLQKLVDAVVGLEGLTGSCFDASIRERAENLMKWVLGTTGDELRADGRTLLAHFGWVICAVLLALDMTRDGDEASREVLNRWTQRADGWPGNCFGKSHGPDDATSTDRHSLDRMIVFGEDELRARAKI